ncbi:MAG: PilN domain-containing protein [Gemmatimonadota bacterium]
MIEINLHPMGDKSRRAKRGAGLSLARPAWLSGAAGGRDPWSIAAIAAWAIVVLVVGVLWLTRRSEEQSLQARLTQATEDSARIADLRTLSDSLILRDRENRDRVKIVESLDHDRFVWPHMMDEVSRALPAYTWLTGLKQVTPIPDLSVQVDGIASSPLAITAYVRNLQASPYIGEVRIVGSQQQDVANITAQSFTLIVSYTPPPESLVRTVPLDVGGS